MKCFHPLFIFLMCSAYARHTNENITTWSKTIAEVYHTVTTESCFPVNLKPAMIKALDAFAHTADSHSHFLGPEEYRELLGTTSGNFYGIGVELAPKNAEDDFLMVLAAKPGSPAAKEGIQRYDRIIAIDGCPVQKLTMHECLRTLKSNRRYSPVNLSLMRGKKEFSCTVTRDSISEESCWSAFLPHQRILYCKISLFTKQAPEQLERALHKGLYKKPKGIILDLRDNAGGVVDAAVDCAGAFLPPKSLIVSTKGRHNKIIAHYYTQSKQRVKPDVPIIVLVNNYTASCAEILAQTLRHYAKEGHISPHVFLVGTRTYGKGWIQEVKPVGNNCALSLTTGIYHFPDNSPLDAQGILPDFVIKQKYPPTSETKNLQKKRTQNKPRTTPRKKRESMQEQRAHALKKDYQLQCACNLLLLLDTALTTAPKEIATHQKALSWLHHHFVYPRALIAHEL